MWVLLVFVVLGCFVVGFFLLGKFDLNHMLIPVVDRPCLALSGNAGKKNSVYNPAEVVKETILDHQKRHLDRPS